MANARGHARRHMILIPGFCGFDALGQLEYYAGVTPFFQCANNTVLHYFDNLPTAAVTTRAGRLRSYLAKRMARGEILKDDEVTLVGHSTGGLDIRWLIWSLDGDHKTIRVDGGVGIEPEAILDKIRSVVFLSVPHWGTNIADWVRSYPLGRQTVVAELRGAVVGAQVPALDRIETSIMGLAASLAGSGLFRALDDALKEADEHFGEQSPSRAAEAHEAASQLALYLRQIAADFRAIDDLTCPPSNGRAVSPAHFDTQQRRRELALWKRRHIEVRTYATLGSRPFRFDSGTRAPIWRLMDPCGYPELAKDAAMSAGTDMFYRTCYRACAGGPFVPPPVPKIDKYLGFSKSPDIAIWDNDGIVNTASMFWPAGENVLVSGDHMDIVGHYRFGKAPKGSGRMYHSYDLLGSASGFSDGLFRRVWEEIFTASH
jgi:triacylglycerol lipase